MDATVPHKAKTLPFYPRRANSVVLCLFLASSFGKTTCRIHAILLIRSSQGGVCFFCNSTQSISVNFKGSLCHHFLASWMLIGYLMVIFHMQQICFHFLSHIKGIGNDASTLMTSHQSFHPSFAFTHHDPEIFHLRRNALDQVLPLVKSKSICIN